MAKYMDLRIFSSPCGDIQIAMAELMQLMQEIDNAAIDDEISEDSLSAETISKLNKICCILGYDDIKQLFTAYGYSFMTDNIKN